MSRRLVLSTAVAAALVLVAVALRQLEAGEPGHLAAGGCLVLALVCVCVGLRNRPRRSRR